jgi:biotin carboxyl carrier protein
MRLDIRTGADPSRQERADTPKTQAHGIDVTQEGNRLRATIDGRIVEGEAVEVATGTYSVLVEGRAFEVRVEPVASGLRVYAGIREYFIQISDARAWKRRRGAGLEVEGRQEILAPMPGKVVRVLVKQGDTVEAGQAMFVVEAMKMQNEIRSPKKGKIERLLVAETQTVNAGESLAVVV